MLTGSSPHSSGGDGHAGARVGVHDAVGVFPVLVDGAVDDEAGRIEGVFRRLDEVAVEIDLHQAGGGDLVVAQAVRVDEEVVLRPRHPHGDVAVDQLAPAEVVENPVRRGELDAQVPLGGAGVVGLECRRQRRSHGRLSRSEVRGRTPLPGAADWHFPEYIPSVTIPPSPRGRSCNGNRQPQRRPLATRRTRGLRSASDHGPQGPHARRSALRHPRRPAPGPHRGGHRGLVQRDRRGNGARYHHPFPRAPGRPRRPGARAALARPADARAPDLAPEEAARSHRHRPLGHRRQAARPSGLAPARGLPRQGAGVPDPVRHHGAGGAEEGPLPRFRAAGEGGGGTSEARTTATPARSS